MIEDTKLNDWLLKLRRETSGFAEVISCSSSRPALSQENVLPRYFNVVAVGRATKGMRELPHVSPSDWTLWNGRLCCRPDTNERPETLPALHVNLTLDGSPHTPNSVKYLRYIHTYLYVSLLSFLLPLKETVSLKNHQQKKTKKKVDPYHRIPINVLFDHVLSYNDSLRWHVELENIIITVEFMVNGGHHSWLPVILSYWK